MKRYLGLLPPILLLAGLLTFCLWTGQRVGADAERWRAPLLQSSEAALLALCGVGSNPWKLSGGGQRHQICK